jgi:hypothetical protein
MSIIHREELEMKFINFVLVGLLVFSGCSKDVESTSGRGLTYNQKQADGQHKYGQLLSSLLKDDIGDDEIRHHIYLLRAGFWEISLRLESVEIAAILTDESSKLLRSENQFELAGQSLIDIQNLYFTGKLDAAQEFLTEHPDLPILLPKNKFTLQAFDYLISNSIDKQRVIQPEYFSKFIEYCRILNSEKASEAPYSPLITQDMQNVEIATDYPFLTHYYEKYKCGGKDCEWPTEDLLAYTFTAGRLIYLLEPFCDKTFPTADKNEQLLYNIYSALVQNIMHEDDAQLVQALGRIDAAGLSTKGPFVIPVQFARSITESDTSSDVTYAKENPLAYVLSLNPDMKTKGDSQVIDADEILNMIYPVLIDANYGAGYRDLLYAKLWFYLWKKDKAVLEKLKLKKGVSLELDTPEYFLSILPYWSEHTLESGLGMKRLKTLQTNFQYLRPLISAYEYIQTYHSVEDDGQTQVQ